MKCQRCGVWDRFQILWEVSWLVSCRHCFGMLFGHYDDFYLFLAQVKPMTVLSSRPVREPLPMEKKRC